MNYNIIDVQICYDNGETVVYQIEELWRIDEYISNNTIRSISKILFYFNHPTFSFYNLKLYNYGRYFIVKFAGDNLSTESKQYDYKKVMETINNCGNLNIRLKPLIINPFIV